MDATRLCTTRGHVVTCDLIQPVGCRATAENTAYQAIAASDTFKALLCDGSAVQHIWFHEWNEDWAFERPQLPGTDTHAKWPIVIIDSHAHSVSIPGTMPAQEHGELNVFFGLKVPEQHAHHPINATRWVTNQVGGILSDVCAKVQQDDSHVKEITYLHSRFNAEHEWSDPNIGRYHWDLYSWHWGW